MKIVENWLRSRREKSETREKVMKRIRKKAEAAYMKEVEKFEIEKAKEIGKKGKMAYYTEKVTKPMQEIAEKMPKPDLDNEPPKKRERDLL